LTSYGYANAAFPDDIRQSMNSTAVKLLQAAAELVEDEKQLIAPLSIAQSLLGKLLADLNHLPDSLLLRAVDIMLVHRQSRIPLAATRTSSLGVDASR
jgi:hypothetical protein